MRRYRGSLEYLLDQAAEQGEVTLEQIGIRVQEQEGEREQLIPNVEIFKEIMVELIKNQEIDIQALKKERREFIQD